MNTADSRSLLYIRNFACFAVFILLTALLSSPAHAELTLDVQGAHQSFEWREPAGLSSPDGDDIVIDGQLDGAKATLTYSWSEKDRRQLQLTGKQLDGTMAYDGHTTCNGVGCGTPITHATDDRVRSVAVFYNPAGKLQSKTAPENLRYNFGLRYWAWESVFDNAINQTMDRSFTSIMGGLSYSTNEPDHRWNYYLFGRAGYALDSTVEFNTSEYGYREDASFSPGSMSGVLGAGLMLHTPLFPTTIDLTYRYRSNQQDSTTLTTNSGSTERWVEPKDTTETLTLTAGLQF